MPKALLATSLTAICVGALAAFWINFVPARGVVIGALVCAAVPAGALSRGLWLNDARGDKSFLFHGAALFLFYALCFLNLSVLVPVLPGIFFGAPENIASTVARKVTSRRACHFQIELAELKTTMKRGLCISEEIWNSIEEGQTVSVTGLRSPVGFFVQEITPNVAQHITSSYSRS